MDRVDDESLQRATIKIDPRDAAKWGKSKKEFKVQFNPTEFTRQKGAQIAEIGIYGLDSPVLQFIRGQNEKLTLELFFDTTDKGMDSNAVSVTTKTDEFYEFIKIQPEIHAPPRIIFSWGGWAFPAIVESIQQRFTLFNPDGIPLRATISLTLREYKTLEEQVSNPKRASADHTKLHVVQQGDTMSGIAALEYGDPALWRPIADANPDQANPRNLTPGTVLTIPALDVAAQST
jgi:hypothetical protein